MIGGVRLMAVLVAISFLGAGTAAVTQWHKGIIRTATEAERDRLTGQYREAAEDAIARSRDAADAIEETPADVEALKKICRRSASCRDRGALK